MHVCLDEATISTPPPPPPPKKKKKKKKNQYCTPYPIAIRILEHVDSSWWRHQMETFSALLAICAGNSPVPGEFSAQRPVTPSFDGFFGQRPNKRLSKKSWGWWFETHSPPLWRHSNVPSSRCAVYLSWMTAYNIVHYRDFIWASWWVHYSFYSAVCSDVYIYIYIYIYTS